MVQSLTPLISANPAYYEHFMEVHESGKATQPGMAGSTPRKVACISGSNGYLGSYIMLEFIVLYYCTDPEHLELNSTFRMRAMMFEAPPVLNRKQTNG